MFLTSFWSRNGGKVHFLRKSALSRKMGLRGPQKRAYVFRFWSPGARGAHFSGKVRFFALFAPRGPSHLRSKRRLRTGTASPTADHGGVGRGPSPSMDAPPASPRTDAHVSGGEARTYPVRGCAALANPPHSNMFWAVIVLVIVETYNAGAWLQCLQRGN